MKSSIKTLRVKDQGEGVTEIRLGTTLTRVSRLPVMCYLVGDILIDTGFFHVRDALDRYLSQRKPATILLTHHHEDHAGNAGVLAWTHDCPVYLRNPGSRFGEGMASLNRYRRVWWGAPEPYEPLEMPEEISSGKHRIRSIPIPGHSTTHTAFFDETSGYVFVGDLFVTGGVTAVMSHENPFESAGSLRRVAALSPTRMFTGHRKAMNRPAAALIDKAEKIEAAAKRVITLHREGMGNRRILHQVFRDGYLKDQFMAALTGGEFSRACFIRACIRHAENY
ncbi:MAG: MBL fold metallo-hydrolase [Deltaproteobacteria bacterium]|nr:MBL fold metallo-hydrolase [Deltaproteobacteria bacterium]